MSGEENVVVLRSLHICPGSVCSQRPVFQSQDQLIWYLGLYLTQLKNAERDRLNDRKQGERAGAKRSIVYVVFVLLILAAIGGFVQFNTKDGEEIVYFQLHTALYRPYPVRIFEQSAALRRGMWTQPDLCRVSGSWPPFLISH